MKFKIKKPLIIVLLSLLFIIFVVLCFFFVGVTKEAKDIKWGVNFSQMHTQNLGLDWKETYIALLDDLKARNIKIAVNWDLIEQEDGKYSFNDLDWQIEQAKNREARLLLTIGMKTPRWPECHIPEWAKSLSTEQKQEKILDYLKEIVLRYSEENAIWAWQVENEPFFSFGNCPPTDEEFLKEEVELVKSLDSLKRPVIISDTGEMSFWFKVARLGDIVGITTYKKVYSPEFKMYFPLPYPSIYYWRRVQIIDKFFDKKVINVELQAEPWGKLLLYDTPMEEQEKTMNLERFKKNVNFAKRTGLDEFYLWGAEWWYWMKKQDKPEIWEEAKKLFE